MSRLTPLWVGLLGWLSVGAAAAQNLEAGKSPAQIFGDTCANCHRSARELKHPSASFMREHYTTSADMASAMAGYLASFPEPRAAQPKPPAPVQGPADANRSRRPATEQANAPEGQGPGRGRRAPPERTATPETRQASNPRRPTASAEAVKPAPPSLEEAQPATVKVEPAKPPLPTFEE